MSTHSFVFIFLLLFSFIMLFTGIYLVVRENKSESYDNSNESSNASRGKIASKDDLVIKTKTGILYDLPVYRFLGTCPAPLVQKQLNAQGSNLFKNGLFEILPGTIYQVRGFDLGNITLVSTPSGYLMIDTLSSKETCKAALSFLQDTWQKKLNIHTVVITHSHIDHFGGIGAVMEYMSPLRPDVIGPQNLVEKSVEETVYCGNALRRRAVYMYGSAIEPSCTGTAGAGLGVAIVKGGYHFDIAVPNITIDSKKPQEYIIDGVRCHFFYTPDAEAPSELMFYMPDLKALCASEILVHSMHNLYSPRGAQVRNGLLWASYIDLCLQYYGEDIQVVFASHHWPIWGNTEIRQFLRLQRDMYRYIHDRTMNYATKGYTLTQIPDLLDLTPEMKDAVYNQPFYGALKMNIRSQYVLRLGFYDGNPVHLDPLPDVVAARKYVDLLGSQLFFKKCQKAVDAKDWRWAATLLNHLVMADPSHQEARDLLGFVYTSLAQQSENAIWRNIYLTGAQELKDGVTISPNPKSVSIVNNFTPTQIFDFFSINIDATKAGTRHYVIVFHLNSNQKNTEEVYVELSNQVLFSRVGFVPTKQCVDATVRVSREVLFAVVNQPSYYETLLPHIEISGDQDVVDHFFHMFWFYKGDFAIVEPLKPVSRKDHPPVIHKHIQDIDLVSLWPPFTLPGC